jgi:hypothetical protein
MDLDTYIEELPSEKIHLVRGKNTPQGRASAEALECLRGNESEVSKEGEADG